MPSTLRMNCQGCGEDMPRNAVACPACDEPNVIDCPVCRVPKDSVEHDDLRLDMCRKCSGAWFDAKELLALLVGELTEDALVAKGFGPEEASAIAERRGDPTRADKIAEAIGHILSGVI